MKANAKTDEATKKADGPISVQPMADGWIFAGFLLFLGVLIPILLRLPSGSPPNPLPLPAALALGAAFFVPGVLLGTWLCTMRVSASETGLIWRRWFTQTETPWAEIGDFYLAPFERRRTQTNGEMGMYPDLVVLNKQGRSVAAFCSKFRNADALKERIAARAIHAKPRAWATKGTRPFDPLPRVFTYATRENRFLPLFFFGQGIALFGATVAMTADMVLRSLARHDFGWWTIGAVATFTSISALVGLLIAIVIKFQKERVYKNEQFIVDTDGFTFCAPNRFERVLWKSVTGYGYAPRRPKGGPFAVSSVPPFRIETETHGPFDFTDLISGATVLREIVRLNAANANQTDWPDAPPAPDATPNETRLSWSGGVEGVGERIFHGRTEIGRALLWLAALPSVVALLFAVLAHFDLMSNANIPSRLTWLVFFTLPFLWAVWRYYAAQIRVGEAGITQRTPWGQTYIAWADVQSICLTTPDPFGAKIVGANGRVIRWTNGFLAGETELRALLAERFKP